MANRKFGWIEQPKEIIITVGKVQKLIRKEDISKAYKILSKFGTPNIPKEFSIDYILEGYTIDQDGISNCVACAAHYASILDQLLAGVPKDEVIYPSTLAMYEWARATHGAQLVDNGTFIFALFEAVAAVGVPDQKDWPFIPSKVNIKPPWEVYTGANDRKWVSGYHSIVNLFDLAAEIKKTVFMTKRPAIFGTPVDTKFCDLRGWDIWEYNGPYEGGHAMTVVGFDEDSLHVLNSHGTRFGINGRFRIGNASVNEHFRDTTIVENFPI